MSSPLLTFLKYIFLAVLYLFFLRVLRAVWIETREPKFAAGEAAVESHSPTVLTSTVPPSSPASGGPEALVEATADGHPGRRFTLGQEVSLGRSPGCAVALPDDTFVSQVHARVFRRDGLVWVEDLGSTNGTFVNESRIDTAVPLHPGDRLRVGQSVLELAP